MNKMSQSRRLTLTPVGEVTALRQTSWIMLQEGAVSRQRRDTKEERVGGKGLAPIEIIIQLGDLGSVSIFPCRIRDKTAQKCIVSIYSAQNHAFKQ